MPVRAVLFDLGNTLWHIPELPPRETIRHETVGRILRLLRSWDLQPTDEHRFLGRDIRLTIGKYDKLAYQTDCVSPDYAEIVAGVAADKGLDLTREQAQQLWGAWNLEGSFFGRRLFEDADETLRELLERGYRLGCVTNRPYSGQQFHDEVDELGLRDYFGVFSVSCDVGYMKPHPEIFRHALDELDVAPEEAVMVGDSLRADVGGAQQMGMIGVWRRYDGIDEEADDVYPQFVVHELRELLSLPVLQPNGHNGARTG